MSSPLTFHPHPNPNQVSTGQVVEQGTHDELLKIGPKGVYYNLVQAQQ